MYKRTGACYRTAVHVRETRRPEPDPDRPMKVIEPMTMSEQVRPSRPRAVSRRLPRPPLPSAVQAVWFSVSPLGFTGACRRRYGRIFRLKLPVIGPIAFLDDPEAISALFAMDGTAGHAGEVNRFLEPVAGPWSLLLLDREAHQHERKLLAPAFHGAAVRALDTVIRDAAAEELARWPERGVVTTLPAMQRITFQVITRAILGADDRGLRARLSERLEPVFTAGAQLFLPGFSKDWGRFSPGGRFRRARRRLDETLQELIEERRAAPPRPDLLGMLLEATGSDGRPLSDEHIRDELVTLLLAGHETTASALAWGCERLANDAQAQRDIRDGGPGSAAAAAWEILRVRPVVLAVGRKLSQAIDLAGYQIDAGTTVMPAIWMVHADTGHYAEPHRFDPHRFGNRRPGRQTWLPFGGGRRRCLGAGLAELEMQIVLGELLARYSLSPASSRPERARLRGVTLIPHRGGRVVVRSRSGTSDHPGPRAEPGLRRAGGPSASPVSHDPVAR